MAMQKVQESGGAHCNFDTQTILTASCVPDLLRKTKDESRVERLLKKPSAKPKVYSRRAHDAIYNYLVDKVPQKIVEHLETITRGVSDWGRLHFHNRHCDSAEAVACRIASHAIGIESGEHPSHALRMIDHWRSAICRLESSSWLFDGEFVKISHELTRVLNRCLELAGLDKLDQEPK